MCSLRYFVPEMCYFWSSLNQRVLFQFRNGATWLMCKYNPTLVHISVKYHECKHMSDTLWIQHVRDRPKPLRDSVLTRSDKTGQDLSLKFDRNKTPRTFQTHFQASVRFTHRPISPIILFINFYYNILGVFDVVSYIRLKTMIKFLNWSHQKREQ